MTIRVLTVCVGNVCRSPAAEYLWRAADDAVTLRSCGVGAAIGQHVHPYVLEFLHQRGIDASAHRARQITVDEVRGADLVLVMEAWQRACVEQLAPGSRGKVALLDRAADIPDPYGMPKRDFFGVLSRIEHAVAEWRKRAACLA